jgi:hypothetical protein
MISLLPFKLLQSIIKTEVENDLRNHRSLSIDTPSLKKQFQAVLKILLCTVLPDALLFITQVDHDSIYFGLMS